MPRYDRTISPLTSIPSDLTPDLFVRILNDKIQEINESFSSLDMLESELRGEEGFEVSVGSNINLGGKRVTGAGVSRSDSDYITRGELRRQGLYVDHTGRIKTDRPIETRAGFITPPATSPNQAPNLSQLEQLIDAALPPGIILIWSGSTATIPIGWALCNGTSGTPDLRNRFIPGAGGTYAVGATGGADSLNLAHSHTADGTLVTDSQGAHIHSADGTLAAANESAHTHGVGTLVNGVPSATTMVDNDLVVSTVAVASATHVHTITGSSAAGTAHGHDVTGDTSSNGAHTHDVTGSTDSQLSAATENRPQFYALAYIMKL